MVKAGDGADREEIPSLVGLTIQKGGVTIFHWTRKGDVKRKKNSVVKKGLR